MSGKMENQRLRHAMEAAHVNIDAISKATDVDRKTVQRWLKGRTPHARHRWTIAELVREREDFLWPSPVQRDVQTDAKTSEIVAAYAHRCHVPPGAWWQLFLQAQTQIDMLANAMLFIPEQNAGLVDMLRQKANSGCQVRIALADPTCDAVKLRDVEEGLDGTLPGRIRNCLYHFRTIRDVEGITIHFHSTILYNSLFRGDNEMFVTPHLYGLHGSMAPLLHIRCLGSDGIFANYAAHFEAVWATTKPLTGEKHGAD